MGLGLRTRFLVALGVAVLAALLLFLFAVAPVLRSNNQKLSRLKDRARLLGKYQHEKVKTPKVIDKEREVGAGLQEQLAAVQGQLIMRDRVSLERPFRDDDRNVDPPLEFGNWRRVYLEKMRELEESLEDSVIRVVGFEPLDYEDPGTIWKSPEYMHEREKEYYVQKEIVDAIADLNAVEKVLPVFHSLRFLDRAERSMHPSHRSEFVPIAFQLSVEMDFVEVPGLLHALLDCQLGLEITSVSVGGGIARMAEPTRRTGPRVSTVRRPLARPADVSFGSRGMGQAITGRPPGMEWPSTAVRPPTVTELRKDVEEGGESLPPDIMSVVVNGYAPDYRQPAEREEVRERERKIATSSD